jgi:hypothetical protein
VVAIDRDLRCEPAAGERLSRLRQTLSVLLDWRLLDDVQPYA